MEFTNNSIREVIQKEGLKAAKNKFKIEDITSELKKDFGLVKEVLTVQTSMLFEYSIFQLLPSEVTHFFEKEIIEFEVERTLQENPTTNKEDALKDVKSRFNRALVRKEYSEKSALYDDLYWGMEFANKKYGEEKVEAIIEADPKLKRNLIQYGRIEGNLEEIEVEDEVLEEEPAIQLPVAEDEQVEEKPLVEEPVVEKEPEKEEVPVVEKTPVAEESPVEEPAAEKEPEEDKKEGEVPVTEEKQEENKKKSNLKNLSPESKKLIIKIRELCDKSKSEKNIVKKHFLRFKIRMLATKIQKELDLYNLKEEYRLKAEEIKSKKDQKQKDDMLAIISINEKIKQRERILSSNAEYDYYSPDFMFPKSTVATCGGAKQFSKSLQEDENPIIKNAGKKVADMMIYREQIKTLRKQMEDRQRAMDARERVSLEEDQELAEDREDKLMVLEKQNNIFGQIKSLLKNVKLTIVDFKKELGERKLLEKEYKQKEQEIRQRFEQEMKTLREEAGKTPDPLTRIKESDFAQKIRSKVKGEPAKESAKAEKSSDTKSTSEPVEHSEH